MRGFFCVTAASHCFTTEQSIEASIFVNVTHLILKGGDSRLKLMSFEIFVVLGQIEANFLLFHILSALCCSFEKWNTSDDEVKNIPLLFSISDWSILFENQWQASNFFCRRRLTERSKMINVCSLECYFTKKLSIFLSNFSRLIGARWFYKTLIFLKN